MAEPEGWERWQTKAEARGRAGAARGPRCSAPGALAPGRSAPFSLRSSTGPPHPGGLGRPAEVSCPASASHCSCPERFPRGGRGSKRVHMAGRRGDAHAAVRAGRWGACRPRVVAISAPLNACRVHGRWPRGGPGQHPTLPAASPLGKPPTRGPVAHSSATPQTLRPQRGGGAGFLPRYPRGRVLGPDGGRERRRVRTWHPLGTRGGQERLGRGRRSLAPGWGRRVPGMAWAGGGSEGKEHETPRARTREKPGTAVSVAGREGKRPAPGSRSCT